MIGDLYCETCDASFQRREHYERHLLTHTKLKPFTCSECGKSFGRMDSLSRHYSTQHATDGGQGSGDQPNGRRRVTQACKPCSLAKVRCDGERPCERCSHHGHDCHYGMNAKRKQSLVNRSLVKRTRTSDRGQPTNDSDAATISVENEAIGSMPVDQQTTCIVAPSQQGVALTNQAASNTGTPAPELSTASTSSVPRDLDTSSTLLTPPFSFDNTLGIDHWFSLNMEKDLLGSMILPDVDVLAITDMLLPAVPSQSSPPILTNAVLPSNAAELYSRAHSPAMDRDEIEPRSFNPSSAMAYVQPVFPDLEHLPPEDVDQENLAHVDEITTAVADKVAQYAHHLEHTSPFPPFADMRIPPTAVLNSWVQLYFEHFHPVFPILHKPSFSSPETHWLLIFTVAAIGARFSGLKGSYLCAGAMHELIRRQSVGLCEQQNQSVRELYMCQLTTLNHLGLMYSGERRALEVAEVLQSVAPTLGRKKGLFSNRFSQRQISELKLSPGQKWQIWTLDEERRRTGFAIWLVDSSFEDHFDLTSLLRADELQMTLPQPEAQWSASSSQSWGGSQSQSDHKGDYTLDQVIRDNGWRTAWAKTGTIGKEVMLRYLGRLFNSRRTTLGRRGVSDSEKLQAEETLTGLLSIIEDGQLEARISEQRAAIAHQIMISAALATGKSPTHRLATVALKAIYGRMNDQSWAELALEWRNVAGQGRLAVFWAARTFQVVRFNSCTHFATPVSLLRAILILWLYSMLADRFGDGFKSPPPAASVVLGPKNLSNMAQLDWIDTGWSQVKLPGISNLLCSLGRCKLLDESIALMRSLKGWGISSSYSQLLERLRANEVQVQSDIQ